MNQIAYPRYLGSFELEYLSDQCDAQTHIGEELKIVYDKPEFNFAMSKKGHVSSKINDRHVHTMLFTQENEYITDIKHYYQEIWSFLLASNYITLQAKVTDFNGIKYTIKFEVHLLKNVFETRFNDDFIKQDDIESKEYKQIQTRKEVQKYCKEAFLILFDILGINQRTKSLLQPQHPTLMIDKLLLQIYKQKDFHYRMQIDKHLPLPVPKIQKAFTQFKEKINATKDADEEEIVTNILQVNENAHQQFTKCDQPSELISELWQYQAQGIQWMLYKEGKITAKDLNYNIQESRLHRMWSEYQLVDGLIYFNEFTGQFSEHIVECKESLGGIVADEMGLGKSIMALGLVLSARDIQNDKRIKMSHLPDAKTLLVVQLSVFTHWINEIENHTVKGSIKYFEYYSTDSRTQKIQLDVYDIVITTYGILGRDYLNKGNLFNYHWNRVILDEAHTIKGRGTLCAKAAHDLDTKIRWCLTGTPLQNNLDELYSLFHFLRIDTFSDYFWFNTYINKQPDRVARFKLLHRILEPILMRRTKASTYSNGTAILPLPDRTYEVVKIDFDNEEARIYEAFLNRTRNEFKELLEGRTLKKSLFHIFAILLFLRQLCDSPFLFLNKISSKKKTQDIQTILKDFFSKKQYVTEEGEEDFEQFQVETIKKIAEGTIIQETCAVCQCQLSEQFVTLKCAHIFCQTCWLNYSDAPRSKDTFSCPVCKREVDGIKHLKSRKRIAPIDFKVKISSKFKKVLEDVQAIKDKGEKCVIYSQWIDVLNYLSGQLRINDIAFQRFDGSMSKEDRQKAITCFSNEYCTVMLASLKAGAFGINLTAANHVLILDPWWNPAVEAQAVERVHRFGQTRPIYIKQYICKATIEQRVLELHAVKKKLFENALNLQASEEMDFSDEIQFVLS